MITDFDKFLDRRAIDTLYKATRAYRSRIVRQVKTSMMMSRKHNEHSMPWQPSAAMCVVVCSLGLTSSATDDFGGRLEQETPINRRHNKQ
jgi:hypothetical protein